MSNVRPHKLHPHLSNELEKKIQNLEGIISNQNIEISLLRQQLFGVKWTSLRLFISRVRFNIYFLVRCITRFSMLALSLQFKKIKNIVLDQWEIHRVESNSIIIPFKNKLTEYNFSLAVFIHAFYLDNFSNEICKYLKNIPYEYDLFLTTNSKNKKEEIEKILLEQKIKFKKIHVVANRGRDIAPKFIEFSQEYKNYKYFLHLHTKKSPHSPLLRNWGAFLYHNLVGSPEIVRSIIEMFESYDQVGMICPEHYYPLAGGVGWGENYEICQKLLLRMGYHGETSRLDFPSGSMFWGRSESIKPLLALNLDYADFQEEKGQTDGTLAHAFERLLFFSCELSGFTWVKTIAPTLPDTDTNKISIENKELLYSEIESFKLIVENNGI